MTRRILVDADLIERMLAAQVIFPLRPDDADALRAALEAPEHEWGKLLADSITEAWQLGQLYWQQADSEFISQQKKSDATREKFIAMREAALGALSALTSTASADPADVAALRAERDELLHLLGAVTLEEAAVEVAKLYAVFDRDQLRSKEGAR